MALLASSSTDARPEIVCNTNAFRVTETSGLCYSRDAAAAGNGPTALPCSVVRSVVVSDGSGTPKITSGPKSIPTSKNDGCTSTLVKKNGTTRDYMPKVRNFTPLCA